MYSEEEKMYSEEEKWSMEWISKNKKIILTQINVKFYWVAYHTPYGNVPRNKVEEIIGMNTKLWKLFYQ